MIIPRRSAILKLTQSSVLKRTYLQFESSPRFIQLLTRTNKLSQPFARYSRKALILIINQKFMEKAKRPNKSVDSSWIYKDTLLYKDMGSAPSNKIASFDMDGTLIRVKSGAKFPKSASDWVWWDDKVIGKIRQLHKDGHRIVIITNQAGISKGNTPQDWITKKIEDLKAQLDVPLLAFIATADDKYRKPMTAIWQFFVENFNSKMAIDKKESLFCGDAAGRKGDFNNTDMLFAKNLDLPFLVPEQLFLGQKLDLKQMQVEEGAFNPKALPKDGPIFKGTDIREVKFRPKEMIILFGAPGSGKSTFFYNYLKGYKRINMDTLKTKQKCLKTASAQLKSGNSVVIDNTNPDRATRKLYIDLAKENGFDVRCFILQADKPLCMHNNTQRGCNQSRTHHSKKVGSVVIHTFFKYNQRPSKDQGFSQVLQVNFIAKFQNEKDKQLFEMIVKGKK